MIDPLLCVDDLHVRPAGPDVRVATGEILEGLDLVVAAGELHAVTGPDGSGRSLLGSVLMGSPSHEVSAGSITFRGDEVTRWPVNERAKAGMFLAFRQPHEIAGVSMIHFLHRALSVRTGVELSAAELRLVALDWTKRLGLESGFVDRPLDTGLTASEKQRFEIMQMAILEPELAILDDTLSGLDLDALRMVATAIREVRDERDSLGVVLITDDTRLLRELGPDRVHILMNGRIVESGGMELAEQRERDGYNSFCAGAVA